MSTPVKPLPSFVQALATRTAARKPTRAEVARSRMDEVDALPPGLRFFWQGSASYSLDADVAAERETVLDADEPPPSRPRL